MCIVVARTVDELYWGGGCEAVSEGDRGDGVGAYVEVWQLVDDYEATLVAAVAASPLGALENGEGRWSF